MTTVALIALPTCAIAIALLLRSPLARRLVADPRGDRWHERTTPVGGGIGIVGGFLLGVLATVAVGAVDQSSELWGILGGVAILFVAGLFDDLYGMRAIVKLATQIAPAALVLGTGASVQIVANDVLATGIGLLWLVGLTNAFNLLDNMDGLAS